MAMNRPFTVRVVVNHEDGSTTERLYERPRNRKMSEQDWASFAVGDLMRLTVTPGEFASFEVGEVSA